MDRNAAASPATEPSLDAIASDAATLAPPEAAALLVPPSRRRPRDGPPRPEPVAVAEDVLLALGDERRRAVLAAAPPDEGRQWARNLTYPDDSVGRIMEPPHAVFRPGLTVAETIEHVRELVKSTLVTYGFVTDEAGVLQGVVAMRDLLLAGRADRLDAVMLREPFSLRPEMPLLEAARLVVARHFPVYPVCDAPAGWSGSCAGGPSSRSRRSRSAPRPAPWSASRRRSGSRPRGRAASASATRGSSSTC